MLCGYGIGFEIFFFFLFFLPDKRNFFFTHSLYLLINVEHREVTFIIIAESMSVERRCSSTVRHKIC